MVTVEVAVTIFGLLALAAFFALLVWAIRRQDRMCTKGFDHTGWNPDRELPGWFRTKPTWFSGGRG